MTWTKLPLDLQPHKDLDGLVFGHAEGVVETGRGLGAVFGPLPEKSLVIAEEGCALHL